MTILFVVPYPKGVAASQRFRVEQLLPLLENNGIAYDVASFWGKKVWEVLYKPNHHIQKMGGVFGGFVRRLILLTKLSKYDYIFIHREATPIGFPWFEWLTAKVLKKKVIFDMDDALWLPNTTDHNRFAAGLKQHDKVEKIIKWSYKISCGNKYLVQYAAKFNQNVTFLPTTVDTVNYYQNVKKQQTERVAIGWTGSHSTLPYLKMLEQVLQRLENEFDFDFIVIADVKPALKLKSLLFVPWQKETEIADLMKLNIGLMPLPETEWAKGKCAFKAIQYMALGIPTVVSAVGFNMEAVPDGVAGFICKSEGEWYLRLKKLIEDPALRSTMGAKGRAWVEQHYSVAANGATFLGLFT